MKQDEMSWVDTLKEFEREKIMVPIQSNLSVIPGFKFLMKALGETHTGDGLVVLFAILNWCISHKYGTEGIWLVPIAEIWNGLIKWHFQSPRPCWVDKRVVAMGTSHEYSFPSSHSMLSFSLATYFSSVLEGSLVPFYFAGVVAFSRVFEGMHYPQDVVIGSALGYGLGLGLLQSIKEWERSRPYLQMSSTSLVACGFLPIAALLVIVWWSYNMVKDAPIDPRWKENVSKTFKKNQVLSPHWVPLQAYIGMTGVLGGLVVGETAFYLHTDKFPMPTSLVASCIRLVVGLTILLAAYFGIRAGEKAVQGTRPGLALCLHFLRFFQVPVVILLVAPPVFASIGV